MSVRTHMFLMLWRQMAGFRARYAAALLALGAAVGLTFVIPLIVGFVIDHGLGGAPIERSWPASLPGVEMGKQFRI